MAKENLIREKALKILTEEKWICWYPKKVKFQKTDIFGIADLICCQGKKIKFIQLTTLPNISFRRKKITNFLKQFRAEFPVEIWAWDKKKGRFKKEKIHIKRG